MKRQREPIKLKVIEGDEAWAYIDENKIQIYIARNGEQIRSAVLYERQILKAITNEDNLK